MTEGEEYFQARAGGSQKIFQPCTSGERENANAGFSEFAWEGFVRPVLPPFGSV